MYKKFWKQEAIKIKIKMMDLVNKYKTWLYVYVSLYIIDNILNKITENFRHFYGSTQMIHLTVCEK